MNTIPTLWLIPARGGSKGIPRKNIKPFCGKSLVRRAVEQALECREKDDTVFVSTDDPEIKTEVEKVGIEVPFMRPKILASDKASTYDVIIHVLNEFQKREIIFERVVLLQPTSPFRTVRDIRNAISLWTPEVDMVVSVVEAKANPYFSAFEADEHGFLHISKGEGNYTRRQDAPKVWEYNGAVYVMTVKSLEKSTISQFKKILPSVMEQSHSIDLDSPTDWEIAEYLFSHIENQSQCES